MYKTSLKIQKKFQKIPSHKYINLKLQFFKIEGLIRSERLTRELDTNMQTIFQIHTTLNPNIVLSLWSRTSKNSIRMITFTCLKIRLKRFTSTDSQSKTWKTWFIRRELRDNIRNAVYKVITKRKKLNKSQECSIDTNIDRNENEQLFLISNRSQWLINFQFIKLFTYQSNIFILS